MKIIPDENNLYKIIGISREISDVIQYQIPQKFRVFDDTWYVHEKWVPFLAKTAKRSRIAVDISACPEYIRSELVSGSDARDVLFVTANAPPFVVDAVWKALAKRYHPDNTATGDPVLFRKYSDAYSKVKGK